MVLNRAVDLSSCDTEPIHMIGAIQPIGALVAVDAATLTIEYASRNTEAYFGRDCADLLGRPLSDLLGADNCAELLAQPLGPTMPDLLRPWFMEVTQPDGSAAGLECYPHQHEGRIILEFVAPKNGLAAMWEEDLVRQRIISELIRPQTMTELARTGAQIIREVTGFDRVMIYRFAEDKHGEVIAESTVREESFLGLHYPASDIPDPARRHFVLNVIRTIPDINAEPVPILTRSGLAADASSPQPLDLTYSKLRAVAPVHVEYLNNMGVSASLSISLISNDELWGLVACHHYAPLQLSWSRMRFCELLGGTISALLQSLENTVQLRGSIQAEKTAFAIESEARAGRPLREVIEAHGGELMEQLSAEGMILRLAGETVAIGKVPAAPCDWAPLSEALVNGVATSDQLHALLGHDAAGGELAGAAMMELSEDGSDWLVLVREAYEQTIRWAGKPEKLERRAPDGTSRLSPRGSFALWLEERRGRSKPFTAMDGEILRITRRVLFAMNSLDRERAATEARRKAEAEEARLRLVLLDSARDRSMGELASALAHELNQPLSAVTNYVNACRQELRNYGITIPEEVAGLMDKAVSESSRAADLMRRLRNFIGQGEIASEPIVLHTVIRQGVELALAASRGAPPEVVFDFEPGPVPISADPVQIGQVVLNLVRNSLAAMEETAERVLTISTRRIGGMVEVSVADTGSGIAPEVERTLFEPFHNSTTSGMGIGLSLCRSIVEAHGGRIGTRPAEKGAVLVFSLKVQEDADA
ncbi:ATP-binding protein [Afifella sp. IM 167]|uniref:ATP-binding protein n=1 Tax=Afifella sp. IM 167 TaxID=2033586 RepID=UPI001CCCBCAC|nr:ATP-binding protein [Afifella sp. IM 167]MBZ8132704.1 hypothetical protein [Afifella sp. IM 167]